jgi:dihydrofolate reductase
VTDGIESAVNQAKAAAAGKSVGVHGADTIQQCLNAGLLDEIHVDIAAVLLGSGVRLFDHLAGTPAVLGNPSSMALQAAADRSAPSLFTSSMIFA